MKPELGDSRVYGKAHLPCKAVNCNENDLMPCCNPFSPGSIQKVESEITSRHVQRSCKNGFFRQACLPSLDKNRSDWVKKVLAYIELCKIKISFFASFSAATGFVLSARGSGQEGVFIIAAVFVLACGASALNHYQERETDALMKRTKNRPVPSGRIAPSHALYFAAALVFSGLLMLFKAAGSPSFMLGLFAVVWYNGVYTPLKRKSPFAAVPGGLTGAVPPVIGWIAAGGNVSDYRLILLCLFFFMWQVPHSWALLAGQGDESCRAGLPSMTNVFTKKQISRIIFNWISSLAVGCLLISMSGIVENMLMRVLLPGISVWIIGSSVRPLLRNHAEDPYPGVFKKINVYMLLVMLMLTADKVFTWSL